MMDERMRRQWAASEAQAYGWGGVRAVSGAIGMSRNTIRRGLAELEDRQAHPDAPVDLQIRRPRGGRKALTETTLTCGPAQREVERAAAQATGVSSGRRSAG